MSGIRTHYFLESRLSTLALLVTGLVLTLNSSWAKERKPKNPVSRSQVVAHIVFSGLSPVDMAMQKQDETRRYLYVQHGIGEGVSIVDISDPSKARVVRTLQWPNPEAANHMDVLGNLAIISETVRPISRGVSNDDVVLWDLSTPADPQVVQRFSGVVKVLEDEHDFIYVLNGEGLWVISAPDRRPTQDNSSAYGG